MIERRPLGARLKSLGLKVGLLIASFVIALLLGECALRVAGVGQPNFVEVDETFGIAPIPGAEGRWTREGDAYVRITEHGYRGVDHPREKPPNTFRLVVLGDSYTEAKQVELEDCFASRLETLLADCDAIGGRRVEVLNFGVSSYGTTTEYLTLRHRALGYHPDAVLLAFLTGNDITDNHADLAWGDRPYHELVDGELVLNDDFRESPRFRARLEGGLTFWIRNNSRIYELYVRARGTRAAARNFRNELGLDDSVYAPPATEAWTEAWAVTEAVLAQMNRELAADGIPFHVVTLSNAIQVDPNPERRERYRRELGVDDLMYPDRRIAAAGARDGYPVLTLVPPLRAYAEEHHAYLHGFENTVMGAGHWNVEGHRVASEHMARWLCAELSEELSDPAR